jgi:MFS family permease
MQSPQALSQADLSPSLRAANRDGMAWAVMVGSGENFLNVFAIFLKASPLQLSLLATLPLFIGALFQILGLWSLQLVSSRRTIVVCASMLNALVWAGIATLALFGDGQTAVLFLIVGAVFYHASGNFSAPPWNSLIGDLVPADIRGRYFGLRNRLIGFCTFMAVLVAGQTLDLSERFDNPRLGFVIIFSIACLSRLLSVRYLKQYEDPALEVRREDHFSFWQFVSRTHRSNFARFVMYAAIVNAAVNVSAPFFAVYMLNELHLSYIEFTLVTATNTVTQFLTMQHWGALSDQFGNKRIINVCGVGIALTPILWVFGSSLPYLFFIQIFAGFVWAGFNLAAVNFIFDAVSPAKRARCVAYQGLVNGLFVLLGSLFGAWFVENVPASVSMLGLTWAPYSSLYFVFVLSGLVRLFASVALLPLFKEVRTVQAVRSGELILRITSLRPLAGATFSFLPFSRKRTK